MTSLAKECGNAPPHAEVAIRLARDFIEHFGFIRSFEDVSAAATVSGSAWAPWAWFLVGKLLEKAEGEAG